MWKIIKSIYQTILKFVQTHPVLSCSILAALIVAGVFTGGIIFAPPATLAILASIGAIPLGLVSLFCAAGTLGCEKPEQRGACLLGLVICAPITYFALTIPTVGLVIFGCLVSSLGGVAGAMVGEACFGKIRDSGTPPPADVNSSTTSQLNNALGASAGDHNNEKIFAPFIALPVNTSPPATEKQAANPTTRARSPKPFK